MTITRQSLRAICERLRLLSRELDLGKVWLTIDSDSYARIVASPSFEFGYTSREIPWIQYYGVSVSPGARLAVSFGEGNPSAYPFTVGFDTDRIKAIEEVVAKNEANIHRIAIRLEDLNERLDNGL